MRNDVQKIFISIENNKLTKVIVVKNNIIETYSSSKYNSKELLNIYSSNVRELKSKYQDEIKNLNQQESIDKLSSLGKIEYQKKNLITNIKIYDQATPSERMFIDYLDGKREEYSLSKNLDYRRIKDIKLLELCNDYNLKYEDLIKSGLVNIYSYLSKVNKLEKVKKENKIKNLIIKNKKLLSSILAGAITVTGLGIGISRLSKKDNNYNYKNVKTVIETTMDIEPINSITPKITIKPTPTVNNAIPKLEKITPPPISKANEILFSGIYNLNDNDALNNGILAKKNYGNMVYYKKDRLEETIKSLNEIRTSNMEYIGKNLGKSLDDRDDLVIIYYENFLNNISLKDKAFVKYFSNIGNKIIKNAYLNNEDGFNEVIKYANLSAYEENRLINQGNALEVLINGKQEKIYYEDLSIDAKELVKNIAWNNIQCLNNMEEENDYSDNLITAKYYGVEFYVFGDNSSYKTMGIKGVQPKNACLIYSRAWAADYMSGTTNFGSSGLTFYGVATENKQTALKVIMTEVMKGRPVVIRVNAKQAFYKGKIKSTPRHFVTVCGIRKNADKNNLKESDFLIYDPTYSKRFKILGSHAAGGSNDRKLLKTEQNTGRRGPNYSDGYYLEVFNDSKDYLELEDVYKGKI